MKYTKIIVDNNVCDNDTIASYLRKYHISNRYLINLRKKLGYIKLNGIDATSNLKVAINDEIEIYNNPQPRTSIQTCIIPLDIVFEDDYILLVNKPAGISTIPNKSQYDYNLGGAIMFYMQDKNPEFVLRVINRLDKEASGLVLVAKNSFSSSYFFNNFEKINKTYFAIVNGIIEDNLIIDKNILTVIDENGYNQKKRIIDEKGLTATTYIFPVKTINENLTLVKIKLENGRTHQIRLHLSSINHPLLGDTLYGQNSDLISHAALICKEMSFPHPLTHKILKFEISYPYDFKDLIE